MVAQFLAYELVLWPVFCSPCSADLLVHKRHTLEDPYLFGELNKLMLFSTNLGLLHNLIDSEGREIYGRNNL